jgi:hypothetical protein
MDVLNTVNFKKVMAMIKHKKYTMCSENEACEDEQIESPQ